MMLVFFSSIGLSANFARLIKGGKPLVIFLLAAAILIVCQNIIGILGTQLLGIDPAYGLSLIHIYAIELEKARWIAKDLGVNKH